METQIPFGLALDLLFGASVRLSSLLDIYPHLIGASPLHERAWPYQEGRPPHPSEPDERTHVKHWEPLDNCDPKYVLTSVLAKLYSMTVGG